MTVAPSQIPSTYNGFPVILDSVWETTSPITTNGYIPYALYFSGTASIYVTGNLDGAYIEMESVPARYSTNDRVLVSDSANFIAQINKNISYVLGSEFEHIVLFNVFNVGLNTSFNLWVYRT